MRYLYTFLCYLALPYAFLRLLWRSRKNAAYRQRWAERLGYAPQLEKCIWIHAASVGETLAALPLIKALKAQYPAVPIVVTNMTINGSIRAQAALGDTVLNVYVPYDIPSLAKRFLQRTNPLFAIFIETELWPNIFYVCHQRRIPIMVANARLSEKSAKGYKRVASLAREMLSKVDVMAVQTQVEANRFIELGLPAERAIVTGSIKFDVELPADLTTKKEMLMRQLGEDRLIWVAASTHGTEEEIILAAHKTICATFPNALLILVPRHPERFDAVYSLCVQQGFQIVRRSQNQACAPTTSVYLGDTMGELMLFYSVCDVAFIGGSFVPVGGHNMLEAAVLGKPVLSGPQLFNFAEISAKLIAAKGMTTVENAEALAEEIIHLFQDTAFRKKMGDNAEKFVASNRGALAKQVGLIKISMPDHTPA